MLSDQDREALDWLAFVEMNGTGNDLGNDKHHATHLRSMLLLAAENAATAYYGTRHFGYQTDCYKCQRGWDTGAPESHTPTCPVPRFADWAKRIKEESDG